MLKRQPHTSLAALEAGASREPLAGLVLHALATCVSVEGNAHVAEGIATFAGKVTQLYGPRAAAYYGTVDAIAALGNDAPFPIASVHLIEQSPPQDRIRPAWARSSSGVVATVTPIGKGGAKLTFANEAVKIEELKCGARTFSHWAGDYAVYTPNCQFSGHAHMIERGTPPAKIVAGCTAGLAPGRLIEFSDSDHDTSVATVYADKSHKKLVAAGCLQVE